ncbi:methyltransferase domain-containing protein [Leptospira mtsangambouensis]|uniref:Methyltransferase domain-containing protein n=2 Tax=Leptospira mtsangambouensis TaxID=2484912 RepID=A0ABY2P3T6_9LEPT|nr:methyltransferase domain-containing protein [Leptospira mtsangambouensis]TGM82143.1 methyltransferase domain-containing protein [Leptospira mtsangambouensis]
MRNQFFENERKIIVGDTMTDESWDAFLPLHLQKLSPFQWTPISVIERTWKYLFSDGVTSVVDLGSGVGKFCINLSLLSSESIEVIGLEDREELLSVSEAMKKLWGLSRVQFQKKNFLTHFPFGHSHYYCFNPLYETIKGSHSIDLKKNKSANQFLKDLRTFKQNLFLLKPKSKLITFHGFGGSYLPGFRLVLNEEISGGEFQVWEKDNT